MTYSLGPREPLSEERVSSPVEQDFLREEPVCSGRQAENSPVV